MKTLRAAAALVGVVLIAALSAACSGGSSTLPTAPTASTPTGTATVESFDGTLDVSGSNVYPFTVTQASSPVNVTLSAATPPPTIYVGLAVGTYSNGTCTFLSGANLLVQAGANAQLSGSANAGSYCVDVYDAGNQLVPITYTVSVSHY
jgi:hypothetical protein